VELRKNSSDATASAENSSSWNHTGPPTSSSTSTETMMAATPKKTM
jgi:hypothetical protein